MNSKDRYYLIDLVKFICSILVVAIHTINRNTTLGYFIVTSARIAVPIFFAINGYFLCDKIYRKDIKSINGYVFKIFKIYIVWSAIYIIFNFNYYFGNNILLEIILFIKRFIFIGTYDHLWYLSTLCVATYIIYFLINKTSFKTTLIVSVLCYIFGLVGDSYYGLINSNFIGRIIDVYSNLFGYVWNSFTWILIFILLGIGIKKYDLSNKVKKSNKLIYIFYLLFILEHSVLRHYNISRDNNSAIFLIPLIFFIFINILNLEKNNSYKIIGKYNTLLSEVNLSIYLMHPLIKIILIKLIPGLEKSYLMFILVLITTMALSIAFYKCKRIKFNRGIVTEQ